MCTFKIIFKYFFQNWKFNHESGSGSKLSQNSGYVSGSIFNVFGSTTQITVYRYSDIIGHKYVYSLYSSTKSHSLLNVMYLDLMKTCIQTKVCHMYLYPYADLVANSACTRVFTSPVSPMIDHCELTSPDIKPHKLFSSEYKYSGPTATGTQFP